MDWKFIWDHQTDLPEGVKIFIPTPDSIRELWEKVRCRQILFPDECCSPRDFQRAMTESCILTSGPGLLRINNIVPITRCEIHGFVLDTAITPFRETMMGCINWIFRSLKVKRVECFIPTSSRSLGRFLRSCGFLKEGHLRNRRYYGGELSSEDLYSILQEDLL